uniref:UDP-N-acetylglucosamine 4-epimerase n=1 Tax=Panagrolaimus davidi TaxID=227884 RepID=A0A914QA78_9BILA
MTSSQKNRMKSRYHNAHSVSLCAGHSGVTGGTGFIGSHCVVELIQANHSVTVISNLANSVSASDFIDTLCKKYCVKKFIFSSSPAVYGKPIKFPIKEEYATGVGITNPYGKSKYMIEKILNDITLIDKEWKIISLRYFNPIGAHPSGIIGENPTEIPDQLMPFIIQVLKRKLPYLTVFGNDFETPDGTCIRDYIHVVDAARGHLSALNRIANGKCGGFEMYNLGMGKGHSVMEIVKAMQYATGKNIPIKMMPRRLGDVPCLCCDPTLAAKNLSWKTTFTLEEMCRDVFNWLKKNPNGFDDEEKQELKQG